MSEPHGTEDKYGKADRERQAHVEAVLHSPSRKKIVVAGPGTGKTHLFKKVLEGKRKCLTLTFVNALVEDLALELCGMSDVRTLHSYARSVLSRVDRDVEIFPKLSEVIAEDAKILLKEEIQFNRLFHNRDDKHKHIPFYRKRRQYYGKYYGFVDIIFALVRFFEENNDRIPTYDQVLVDEFQDFNKLEVSLIELLAEKSPVLIVGDDDQALYDFKDASPDHIRRRYTSRSSGYASFELPYCSRCTRVIVKAANDIIASATANGCFKTRIKKKFEYFDHKRKDRESDKNPKIIHASLFAAQIPWFIQQRIEEIAQDVRDKFSVLIISPTKTQSRHIVAALREKGFKNITTVERGDQQEPSLLDGLEILLDDKTSNLGWRIAAKFVLDQEAFESMLQETNDDSGKTVSEIIGSAPKKKIKAMLKILRALRNDEGVDEQELLALTKAVGIEPLRMARDALRDRVQSSSERIGNPGIRKIPIRATTIESSKGLTDEYVFITHFDDLYFIKDNDKGNVTDRDVCKFLVALTRARKKVFLISSDVKNEPTFLTWIDNNRIERIKVVDS